MHMPEGYPVSAEMVEEGRLLEVPTDAFGQRLRRDPDLAISMLVSMAVRLKHFVEPHRKNGDPDRCPAAGGFPAQVQSAARSGRGGRRTQASLRQAVDRQPARHDAGKPSRGRFRPCGSRASRWTGATARIRDVPALQRFTAPDSG